MKIKTLLLVALLVVTAAGTTATAQSYKSAFGARLGYENGITLKHFLAPQSAVEGILSFSDHYFNITGMYEYQQPLKDAPGLDWFLGLGAHAGSIYTKEYDAERRLLAGIDIIGGVEYTFPTAPFVVTLDWKPSFNLSTAYNNYWYAGLALSLRYTFK